MIPGADGMSTHTTKLYIQSDQDVRCRSVCEIVRVGIGGCRSGSILDGRMGSYAGEPCETCGEITACPGHPGHLELGSNAVVHPLLIHKTVTMLRELYSNWGFRCSQHTIEVRVSKAGAWRRLSGQEVRGLLPSATCDHLVIGVVPIPSLAVRPTVQLARGSRATGENSMTTFLLQLVKTVLTGEDPNMVSTYLRVFMDGGNGTTNRKSFKSIKARIGGKRGRLRQNLLGKRCDYTARTVIVGSAMLAADCIELPPPIYEKQSICVPVTVFNVDRLRRTINKPMFVAIIKKNKTVIRLSRCSHFHRAQLASNLEPGDIVRRCLQTNDIVLINRQPSLHRHSFMAHRVRLGPPESRVIVMSNACTPAYNADFDGDEVNVHVPQMGGARAEVRPSVGHTRWNHRPQ